jgi:hypothetical protein
LLSASDGSEDKQFWGSLRERYGYHDTELCTDRDGRAGCDT